jgi:hypothetical protein
MNLPRVFNPTHRHVVGQLAMTATRCLLLATLAVPVQAQLSAVQINHDNLDQRVGGMRAIGGLGDWMLSNGNLCATISAAQHETGLSITGGWLVDLGHCGRSDDQLAYTHLMPMMERNAILPVTNMEAAVVAGRATLTVQRANASLAATIRYSLSSAEPDELLVESELTRVGSGHDVEMVGQVWSHPERSLTPFTIDTRNPLWSPGYRYKQYAIDSDPDELNSMIPADLTVLVGGDSAGPGISYGIQSLEGMLRDSAGVERPVLQFSLVEADYTNQVWLSRPLWFGGGAQPGRLEMLQSLFMDLDEGESLRLRQRIMVSRRADVASITDRVYTGHVLSGQLDTSAAHIAVHDAAGNPLSDVRPEGDGSFKLRLPAGMAAGYLQVSTDWAAPQRIDFALDNADIRLAPIATAPPATVVLPRGKVMRLVFVGLDETATPQWRSDHSGFQLGEKSVPASPQSNSVDLVGNARDPATLQLAPGNYRVYASRGIEYSVSSEDIVVGSGDTVKLSLAAPQRVLDIDGAVSADFHVHSGYSYDSAISAEQRLRSFIAQGAEVLFATEHDTIVDLGASAKTLGLDAGISVVSGVELTGMAHAADAPRTMGHLNVFPLPADRAAFAGGVPAHEGKRLRQVMGEVRREHPQALFQLNHPRDPRGGDDDRAFFDHLSVGERFNPGLPLDNVQNRSLIEPDTNGVRDLDFDLLELANGSSLALYQQVRADWLSLILQGEYRPALASSDSHHLRKPVAMPRSYVAYPGPVKHPVDTQVFLDAVRSGRVYGSSGPIPSLQLRNSQGEQAGIGETLRGTDLTVTLSVRAAPWVDVNQVWVYLNGMVIRGGAIVPGEAIEIPLRVASDSFIFAEFYGQAGEIYKALAPGYQPMAFTNPIWIDADGDGKWQAPGIASIPMAISLPGSIPNEHKE